VPAAGAIRAARAYVELFADDSQLVRGLRNAQAKLKAFGSSVQQFGRQLLTLGTLAAAPLAASTKTFAGFEQEMARVRALTGANATQFERLNAQAKRLGATTVFSASQAAEAMSYFALAGYSVDQILAASGPTLDLAAAGQLEMAQAADISAKIMAGMGVSANDLGRAIDVLTKGMTTANTDLVQLGDAMKYVGPVAKQAGYSLEETVAAVQLLSNAGIQADMAGTTLRGAILSLVGLPDANLHQES
jgi:TP901 family phage tail tape measure protein